MSDELGVAAPSGPGSREPSPSVSALTGFDPSREDDPDPYWEYDEEDCANCGGEGFVYGCSWDWQCDTWDGDSCLCTRPCEWCQPVKDSELRAVLAAALAQQDHPEGQEPDPDGSAQ